MHRHIRNRLEKLMRGRRVKRCLSNGVHLYVSPDSQLKYLLNRFDDDLIDMGKKHAGPDSVVWDVGANCGVLAFSCAGAKQIVAVEADPFLCNLIQESIAMNSIPLVLISAAVSSDVGLSEFSIAEGGRASNCLSSFKGSAQASGVRSRILVPTITLDSILDAALPPTLVKIDVEGAEIAALQGATRLLREVRPVLYLEANDETLPTCTNILSSAGYTITKAAEMNWICLPA